MRRFALLSILTLPFVVAALPALSLFGVMHPATEGAALVVFSDAPAGANAQFSDSASPGLASDPVAYGVSSTDHGDCHVSSTTTIEG